MTAANLIKRSLFLFLFLVASTSIVSASVVAVGPGAFAGSTPVTFTGLADGTEVNGLTFGGIQFSYSLGNGQVIIDGGPGVTNNISPANIVSIGNNTGILTLTLSGPVNALGYGYAILSLGNVTAATTITLFDGLTNVGSLSYNGVLDPNFTGGFAGILSTIPFNRAEITFNSALAPAFALDNIVTASNVPEPATMLLMGSGLAGLAVKIRRRRKSI